MATNGIIWIDHKEARVFHVAPDTDSEVTILAPQHHLHRHPKGHSEPHEHPEDVKRFFHGVARIASALEAILIVGPSSAKLEFFKYLGEHDPAIAAAVVGVESADHPTDGEIVARARSYFKAAAPVH